MKARITLALLICSATLLSCTAKNCGADKETHGCIGTAGYVWSELLQECVRPWETGTAVAVPRKEADTYTRQYNIVFSADSTKAELIGISLLTKVSDNVWQNTDASIKVVKAQDGFSAE